MILKSHQHLFLAVLVFLISAGVKAGEADAVETPADTAAAAIEKLGGVVWTKTSQSGEQYVEVDIRASRRWIGGGEGFKHLDALANVRSLVIQGIDQFGDQEMVHLRGLCDLRSLRLINTQVTDDGLLSLWNLTNIESLSLSSSKFTDGALAHVKGLDKLKTLRLDGSQVTDRGLGQLKESKVLDRIEFLCLNWCKNITDAGLRHLKHMSSLKSLYLYDTQVTDLGLAHLSDLPGLEKLILSNTGVSDAGMAHLAGLKHLWLLDLNNTKVTDAGLEHFRGLTDLSYLGLAGTKVTDAGLVHIAKLAKMEELRLDGCRVTDAGLEHLKDLVGLKTLSLIHLDVTDAGLVHLQKLTELEWLDLNHSRVTDAGLEHLKGLTRLKFLFLNPSDVTNEGYKEIERALPDCDIYWAPRPSYKAGDPAPKLSIDRLLQAPQGAVASWEKLKGKVVVLEFWATWCGPCVAAIPHLNALAEEFKDRPVQFIAITTEEQDVVEQFLKKGQMKAWIGLDPDRSTDIDYNVHAIPRTIVVDKTGAIRAITSPTDLTSQSLNELLVGRD